MGYATQQDIDDLYGPDMLIRLADQDRSGQPDPQIVRRGLASADGIINGYLEGQYDLPIVGTSAILKELAVDIAIYKIALQRSVRTTEMRTRYEDAITLLDKIAARKIGLGIETPGGGDGDGGTTPPIADGGTQSGRSINTYLR